MPAPSSLLRLFLVEDSATVRRGAPSVVARAEIEALPSRDARERPA